VFLFISDKNRTECNDLNYIIIIITKRDDRSLLTNQTIIDHIREIQTYISHITRFS